VRILLTNERASDLDALSRVAESLGDEVVGGVIHLGDVARVAAEAAADVAVVGLVSGDSSAHALAMIDELVRGGVCPVIAITDDHDAGFVSEAAQHGVYAHATWLDPVQLRGVLDIALRRFRDHADLEAVAERRTYIERAKGILMERYGLDAQAAFAMLRRHARSENLTLRDAAQRILESHRLLPRERTSAPPPPR
jgi:response regulator NasT